VLSGRGLCDELITRPEESYRLCCVVVCDLETSRMGAPYIYIYDISHLRVKHADYEYRSVSSFGYMDDDDPQSPSETRQFPVVIYHTDRNRRNRI